MIERLAAVILTLLVTSGSPGAQEYPSRLIRVVVGPGPDIVARLFAPRMSEALGQQVVIEPRPGAGGVIAAQTIATAQPDGYNLLLATASYTINTALKTSPYDMRKDFSPIGRMSISPFVLVVHPSVPAKTVQELIALAKSKPGQLNYASSGIGTPPHLAGELFKAMAGIDIVHVPFREANSALNAVVGGNVQMMFSIATTAQSQIEAGTVRGLGVTTLEPTRLVPNLPLCSAIRLARLRGDRLERPRRSGWYAKLDHRQAEFSIPARIRRRRHAKTIGNRGIRGCRSQYARGFCRIYQDRHRAMDRHR